MKKTSIPYWLFLLLFLIPACLGLQDGTETPAPTPNLDSTPTPQASPDDGIVVCMGQEPNSLYPFGELNTAARNVLAAIYDGPIDNVGYEYQPVILTQLPSLENGDAQIVKIAAQSGDSVLDAGGNLIELTPGSRIRPAGCRNDDCAVAYDGVTTIEMDQMIVAFRLRPDLAWSDGAPLTADDSIYSFELQREADADDYLIQRTQSYEAADAQTLQWFGVPGFIDSTYFLNFWQPAPRHAWSEFPADQLPDVDVSSREPIGWGPYAIKEWISGEAITLEKNPHYFRIRDGYPRTETIRIRFIPDPDTALSEMIAGRCDLIEPTLNLENHVGLLKEMQDAEEARMFAATGMSMEWLGFSLAHASYDNGYDVGRDRQNFFADTYTRQGIAYCLDRGTVAASVLYNLTDVPATYLPSNHPAFNSDASPIPYDPQIGVSLLEQAGWRDTDEDPSTPRRAVNVKNVAYNTPLLLKYQTTSTAQRRQVTAILERSLAECGIGLEIEFVPPNDLYAPGPDGPLFGRQFDLAQYALGAEGSEPPCGWFTSDGIPSESNSWSGSNITGYRNADYDQACRAAQFSMREDSAYLASYRQTQIILAEGLPAIPLYSRLRIAAARPDLCGFDLDPSANALWNVEAFEISAACQN